eukprot:gene1245-2413_t
MATNYHQRPLLLFIFLTFATVYSTSSSQEKMNNYQKRIGKKFLDEIATKEDIIVLKSGMLIKILTESKDPNAKSPNAADSCEVTYSGTLKDGTKFDSGTTSFAPNQVIKGWFEAMQYMAEGDKWTLYIPYNLAYGERGSPPKIPPYAPLVFDIEIHKVKSGGKSKQEAKKKLEENIANLSCLLAETTPLTFYELQIILLKSLPICIITRNCCPSPANGGNVTPIPAICLLSSTLFVFSSCSA